MVGRYTVSVSAFWQYMDLWNLVNSGEYTMHTWMVWVYNYTNHLMTIFLDFGGLKKPKHWPIEISRSKVKNRGGGNATVASIVPRQFRAFLNGAFGGHRVADPPGRGWCPSSPPKRKVFRFHETSLRRWARMPRACQVYWGKELYDSYA